MRICVFCGASSGRRPEHAALAAALGRELGRRRWELVYGGGRVGLMGVVADATLAAGGQAVGVIPRLLVDREQAHGGLTRLEVVDSLHQRKARMFALADAIVTLPGGIGTLDELAEALTWRHLGLHRAPIGVLDAGGFFAPLLAWLARAEEDGFLRTPLGSLLAICDSPAELLDRLTERVVPLGAEVG